MVQYRADLSGDQIACFLSQRCPRQMRLLQRQNPDSTKFCGLAKVLGMHSLLHSCRKSCVSYSPQEMERSGKMVTQLEMPVLTELSAQ